MGSRAARVTAWAAGLTAFGFAGYFVFQTEKQIAGRLRELRAFDLGAREAAGALANMRAAQQAYVAAGQGTAFWMPEVDNLQGAASRAIDALRASAVSNEARASLLEAASNITEFGNVDKRARDYMRFGQTLMAGDVVFAEGSVVATTAERQVESSRLAEAQAFDAAEAVLRRQQAAAIGAAGILGVFVMTGLAFAAPRFKASSRPELAMAEPAASARPAGELMLRAPSTPSPSVPPSRQSRESVPILKAAADLCTEFNRITDTREIPRLLERAAEAMDASGLVVWLGSAAGADLRPVLAHGYPDQVLARMPNVPRSADNAAALAYRTGKLQIVLKRPGASNGAIVAPLLAPEGCVGAFTAEIRAGNETADSVQALAALVAAQLTGVLGSAATTPNPDAAGKIASA